MADYVRFVKPNTVMRGSATVTLYTWLRFYNVSSFGLVELFAYDTNYNPLTFPFTTPTSLQQITYSGQWNGSYYTERRYSMPWIFKTEALALQSRYFQVFIWSMNGALLDYVSV